MYKRPPTIKTILAVDDDDDVRATIARTLRREEHRVVEAADAQTALYLAREQRPDLIILDITLPGTNGFDLCAQLRSMPFITHTPILFLSVHQGAQFVARALDCGGDDYLRKPFAPRELTARVRALLRRSLVRKVPITPVLRMHPDSHSVTINDQHVLLTPTEYGLLEHLCRNREEHHTATSLLEKLWRYPPGGGDTALVRNHIRNLRRKIERDPDHPTIITSLHGRGYAIEAQVIETGVAKTNQNRL